MYANATANNVFTTHKKQRNHDRFLEKARTRLWKDKKKKTDNVVSSSSGSNNSVNLVWRRVVCVNSRSLKNYRTNVVVYKKVVDRKEYRTSNYCCIRWKEWQP